MGTLSPEGVLGWGIVALDPILFDHLLTLVLVAVVPLESLHAWSRLRAALDRDEPDARITAYRRGLVLLWGLTALLFWLWLDAGRALAGLGIQRPDGLLAWAILAAAVGLSTFQILAMRGLRARPDDLERVREKMGHLGPMLPTDAREYRWFAALSLTAGITEELLYRGFLIAYLATWVGVWPAVLLSSVAFGVAHSYQGGAGSVLQTGTVGLVLGVVYVLSGAIWAPMVLHAAVDLSSGWAAWQALEPEGGAG